MAERLQEASPKRGRFTLGALPDERPRGDDARREDKGPDAQVHERGAPRLDLCKSPGEETEVDSEDGDARQHKHGAAVGREERLHGEDVRALGGVPGLGLWRYIWLLPGRRGLWFEEVRGDCRDEKQYAQEEWLGRVEGD